MPDFGRLTVALATGLLFSALVSVSNPAIAQDRIVAIKGGDTIALYPVWFVRKCKSIVTAAPTVELLDGPPLLKLWVEPAMVVASRLKCTEPVTGGKLMVTAGTVHAKADVKIKFRVIYQTTEGEQQVARAYDVSLFPGDERADAKAEPSQSWNSFLASLGTSGDTKGPSRFAESSSASKRPSVRKIIKRHKLTRVASADQAIPRGVGKEALYVSCRYRVHAKYGWKADGKNWMWREQSLGMTNQCVSNGGKIP